MRSQIRSGALVLAGVGAGIALVLSCNGPSNTMAQTCGSCTVDGPVQIAGPTKVITAETDIAQMVTGSASAGTESMAVGPVVITDIYGFQPTVQIGPGTACPVAGPIALDSNEYSIRGARIVVPAGSVGCVKAATDYWWSGYKPY